MANPKRIALVARTAMRTIGGPRDWRNLVRTARRPRAPRARPGKPQFLGDLSRAEPILGGLELYCDQGVLRIEFLADGVARVQLSRTAVFAPVQSYAVVDPTRRVEVAVSVQGEVSARSPVLGVSAAASPCRLTFSDSGGRILCADAGGAGWRGAGALCSLRLPPGQAVYGLGEKAFGLNHRGRRLTMWNTDPRGGYRPGTDPLYISIPWALCQRDGVAYGLLFDNPSRAQFDLGFSQAETLLYHADGGELCYYVIAGPAPADVLARYADLTGHASLPPRWGLGYHQSRWGYASEADVRQVAAELRARRIPCDAIYLDIDHMDGYRVFTWDRARFPDPSQFIADIRAEGFRAVAIVDAGVKADPTYQVCSDGLARDVFCKLADGKPYTGHVWPGACYFPDFSNADVRQWWGEQHQGLVEAGVAGIWNDMNEPAVFPGTTLPDVVQHRTDGGLAEHRELHNAYGLLMARASAEALRRLRPGERPYLVSRSGYAGIQRYALNWTGDNESSWAHLRLSIPMVLNMGMSGQPFAGADVGGFSGDADGELLVRWTQLGAFLPFFRNHCAITGRPQEPYAFGEPCETICRLYIELRYRLMPYLYTAFWQAAETGLPVARSLAFAFPADRRVASLDDEYLYGDALLVAPILAPGGTGRGVYLPRGAWYDFWSAARLDGPDDVPARAPLERLPLYVRAGSVVPMGPVMQYSDQFVPEKLELHLFGGAGDSQGFACESWLYEDDGHSLAYLGGAERLTRFLVEGSAGTTVLTRTAKGRYEPGYGGYDVLLRGSGGQPARVLIDGVPPCRRSRNGVRHENALADTEWGALRIQAGLFERMEIQW